MDKLSEMLEESFRETEECTLEKILDVMSCDDCAYFKSSATVNGRCGYYDYERPSDGICEKFEH